MIEFNPGVTLEQTFEIQRIGSKFFELSGRPALGECLEPEGDRRLRVFGWGSQE
jgi:hypothetical protein